MLLPVCAIFRRYIKKQGLKFTPERAKILDAVLSKEDVFEADALHDEMRQAGHRVSKATIYRTLRHLVDARIVAEVLIDAKQAHYQLSVGQVPKAHLVCMETNQIIEHELPELTELAQRICAEHGYKHIGHRFIVHGVSPEAGGDDEAD